MVSLGVALGPSVGGLLLGVTGWRSVFLINVPLGIIASFLVVRVVPPSIVTESDRRFDFVGALLALFALSSFCLGMTQGQYEGFGSYTALALLAIAAIGLAIFLVVEARLEQPLLELYLFRNLRLSMGLLSNWLVFIVITGSLLITPFFLEQVKQYPTAKVGLLLAVSPVVSGAIAPLSGALSDRFGTRLMGSIGLSVMVSGCLAISTFNAQLTESGYVASYLLYGIGFGIFRSPNDSSVMGAVPNERLGIASGLLSLTRTLGVNVGVSLIGAVFGAISANIAPNTDITTAPAEAVVAGFQGSFRLAALILGGAVIATAIGSRKSRGNYCS